MFFIYYTYSTVFQIWTLRIIKDTITVFFHFHNFTIDVSSCYVVSEEIAFNILLIVHCLEPRN